MTVLALAELSAEELAKLANLAHAPRTEIVLGPKRELKRSLTITFYVDRLTVVMNPARSAYGRMLAWAQAEIADCRLSFHDAQRCCLWVGTTAFELTDSEGERLAAAFPGCGLRVDRREEQRS